MKHQNLLVPSFPAFASALILLTSGYMLFPVLRAVHPNRFYNPPLAALMIYGDGFCVSFTCLHLAAGLLLASGCLLDRAWAVRPLSLLLLSDALILIVAAASDSALDIELERLFGPPPFPTPGPSPPSSASVSLLVSLVFLAFAFLTRRALPLPIPESPASGISGH